ASRHGIAGLRLRNHRANDFDRLLSERSRSNRNHGFHAGVSWGNAEADSAVKLPAAREDVTTCLPFTIRLTFKGDLVFFLKRTAKSSPIERTLKERTSVKDVIESCGVPH